MKSLITVPQALYIQNLYMLYLPTYDPVYTSSTLTPYIVIMSATYRIHNACTFHHIVLIRSFQRVYMYARFYASPHVCLGLST